MYMEYITIIAVLLLSYLGHNMTVVYAAGIVLALKVLGLTTALNALGTQGINWGIIILTAAILVPIAHSQWHHHHQYHDRCLPHPRWHHRHHSRTAGGSGRRQRG